MATIPLKDSTHSWSVALFETHRPLLTTFIKTKVIPLLDAAECRRILIRAPVKSGKREMVEYLATRDYAHNPQRVHAFVSSFHRVADEEQRKELKIHNMEIFSLTSNTHAEATNRWIDHQVAMGKQVVLHIDECDFGAGQRQILGKVYQVVRSNEKVTSLLYSATPQEVLCSGEVGEEEYDEMVDDFINMGEWIEYTPPDTFCGPKKFLDEGLVAEANPFFYKDGDSLRLSEQGKDIVGEARANATARNGRNIVVLRLSYANLGGTRAERKDNKAIYQFLRGYQAIPELADFLVYVDKGENIAGGSSETTTEKIQWSKKSYWRGKTKDEPILIVIDQTSSRSTEWACHDRVLAYHDFRNTIVFSTISQAQERVNHYTTRYGIFQNIKVFGHLKTFQFSAGMISLGQYLHCDWEKRKVDRRSSDSEQPVYQIRSTSVSHHLHPRFSTPLTLEVAEQALQELGCYAEIKVSPRVRGGIRRIRVQKVEFCACSPETFSLEKTNLQDYLKDNYNIIHTFRDDYFVKSGQKKDERGIDAYPGYLGREGWKVTEFKDVEQKIKAKGGHPDPHLIVCYRDGMLGVALAIPTGEWEEKNTLATHGSIYKN